MFKLFLLIIAFSLYGAHAFLAQITGGPASELKIDGHSEALEKEPSWIDKASNGAAHYAGTWVGQAAEKVGIKVEKLENNLSNCQNTTVDTENLEFLIETLPESQKEFFRQILSKTPTDALPLWYQSEKGSGLCVKSMDIVVMVPK